MFSKATATFVQQVDPDGSFIHVSRVNDSHKLLPLALVVKRNRYWFWQSPKYRPTDFTLADVLQGAELLRPGETRSEFLSYQGTFRGECAGKLDAEASPIRVSLEGRGSSHLQSTFNKLQKVELNVKELLQGSANRLVDMQHVLVQQLKKKSEVLAVVKEAVLTTESCSLKQIRRDRCSLNGVFSLLGQLGCSDQVAVKDSNSVEMDSKVSLVIPSGTIIAYSVMELEIERDGQYVIGLQPGTIGRIHSVSPSRDSVLAIDGTPSQEGAPVLLGALLDGSADLDLGPLALLHQEARRSVFEDLREAMKDHAALSSLQCLLQDLSCGETLQEEAARGGELSDSQWELVWAVLGALGALGEDKLTPSCSANDLTLLGAAHMLVSALEELPDETLSLLSCCSPDLLTAFDSLLRSLKEGAEPRLFLQHLPAPLRDEQTLQQGAELLSCTDAALRWDGERLWLQENRDHHDEEGAGLPVAVLYVATHGLMLLAE